MTVMERATAQTEFAGSRSGGTPVVVHVIHRLAVGGLENGLVNLINHMPPDRFRHAIVSLTDATDFRMRIGRPDVPVICLHKREGQDLPAYGRLLKLLRKMEPEILHSRTMAALDSQIYAMLAGVPVRIHSEHGQASSIMEGGKVTQKVLRQAVRPLVDHYITVNRELANYLVSEVGISGKKVTPIYNGVDTARFYPRRESQRRMGPAEFFADDSIVIGTVGRIQPVKDQASLVDAFVRLVGREPTLKKRLRLVIVGDGPLLADLRSTVEQAGVAGLVWLPGEREDIPEVLRTLDMFVLPSLGEGTSNTILEAMASGLPVIATHVGGNPDLVEEGCNGRLVCPKDPDAIAGCIHRYVENPQERAVHGAEARRVAEERFSLRAMVNGYTAVYESVLARKRRLSTRGAAWPEAEERRSVQPRGGLLNRNWRYW
jgi:sugar transferase (PEP-CTERM/EpsH1 system associated)